MFNYAFASVISWLSMVGGKDQWMSSLSCTLFDWERRDFLFLFSTTWGSLFGDSLEEGKDDAFPSTNLFPLNGTHWSCVSNLSELLLVMPLVRSLSLELWMIEMHMKG